MTSCGYLRASNRAGSRKRRDRSICARRATSQHGGLRRQNRVRGRFSNLQSEAWKRLTVEIVSRWVESEFLVVPIADIFACSRPCASIFFVARNSEDKRRTAGWRPVVSILPGMFWRHQLAGWVVVCVLCGNKGHFEGNQQAVFPALGRLLRAHSADPKCSTTELCFLLRVGWVVVRLLGGRGRRWCAPAGCAHAKLGADGGSCRGPWVC